MYSKLGYLIFTLVLSFLTLNTTNGYAFISRGGGNFGNADYSDVRNNMDRNGTTPIQNAASYRAGENNANDNDDEGNAVLLPPTNTTDSVDQENNAIFNSYSHQSQFH
jgi:hypothetical protein